MADWINTTAVRILAPLAVLLLVCLPKSDAEGPATLATSASTAPPEAASEHFQSHVLPFLMKHCGDCHGGGEAEAGISISRTPSLAQAIKERRNWRRVATQLATGAMPPADADPRPDLKQSQEIANWLQSELDAGALREPVDPGRVTIRRLNRVEYNNTIRDLVGVDFQPAADFPADDVGYGFDNNGDVLSMPPVMMEKYLTAAERIMQRAIVADRNDEQREQAESKLPFTTEITAIIAASEQQSQAERQAAAEKIIAAFARRAFRRPVSQEEVTRLVKIWQEADEREQNFARSMQFTLSAVLVSPHFLFRVENDPPNAQPGSIIAVSDLQLASRLSYFLWSSMPDDELLALAERGELRTGDNLHKQVRRMLKDSKANALAKNFAGQWLEIRRLSGLTPDPKTYPTFDQALRDAMRTETEMYFTAIMAEDRSLLEFLDADYTFLNERLAEHYGIDGVSGEKFRRVSLRTDGADAASRTRRGGILTHASILSITSNPTRTSPVKRGKWVLDNILGTPPADPPPNVPELEDGEKGQLTGSLKQRLEQHRSEAACASCHREMDPIGFGLENFDGIGAWREKDGKHEIDSAGELSGGRKFNGPAQLRQILQQSQQQFIRCLSERMLTYALGRGVEESDEGTVLRIAKQVQENDNRFSALVLAIVDSVPFQNNKVFAKP